VNDSHPKVLLFCELVTKVDDWPRHMSSAGVGCTSQPTSETKITLNYDTLDSQCRVVIVTFGQNLYI